MSATPSPRGWELLLVMAGALAAMTGTTAAYVTHDHVWRYLVVAGCFVQCIGWVRHGCRQRGGAR
ncbi:MULTISPECIES: hypothetical protein [Streptomyces]|jgi:hypothetical protein|uniref:Uncharacterized protein n=1 Tax=Streptomyces spinosisporus TaxID=2927582 RepID=A0ABS9XDT5_9ACTN|nr:MULTISPECIES: hypothetical protein [Streptomyces]MCI3240194.1 hypothetical protein [Streptomyces spinosisporus]WUB38850.1 hypothetical protein OHN38_29530 [Streptomyces sp. NBC_00588]